MFQTKEDLKAQEAVAKAVEKGWKCTAHCFGEKNPIDWWFEKDGEVAAFAELKVRKHSSDTYDTVYLSVRKWLALDAVERLGVPALFVVQFTDGIWWIGIAEITENYPTIITRRVHRAENDREPALEVPIREMKRLTPP